MSRQGFALHKNGSCPTWEKSCGKSWAYWETCCPRDTDCGVVLGSTQCSTAKLEGPALSQCSNSTWDLYQANGFFCCETGQIGFTSTDNSTKGSFGCATNNTFDGNAMSSLSIIEKATTISSHTSTTAPSPTPTTAPSPTPTTPTTQKATKTGGIAGGVVGGICLIAIIAGLLWLFLRRRSKQSETGKNDFLDTGSVQLVGDSPLTATNPVSELAPAEQSYELAGSDKLRHELRGDDRLRSELPADRHSPAELP